MNKLVPHADAEFPARRPEPLTPAQWEAVNFAYEKQPAFIRRYIVTGVVLVAGTTLVAFDIIATGFNVAAAGAAVAGVSIAYVFRSLFRFVTVNATGTAQHYGTPDQWPATMSRETSVKKQVEINIVNHITVNQ